MNTHTGSTSSIKSLFATLVFIVGVALGGCSTDAIVGPEESDGLTHQTTTNPKDPEPSNDDCSVGGC